MMRWREMPTRARHAAVIRLRPRGKLAFLASLPRHARVLDVGCGNNSARDAKILRTDLVYEGLDVAEYNQAPGAVDYADSYTLVAPELFAEAIACRRGQMDAVVSSHNLEHCNEPDAVLRAMAAALRPGGRLYLALPCEESVHFPHRRGTLNFHDDPSHRALPRWGGVLQALREAGLALDYEARRYRPLPLALAGALLEPVGALTGRNMPAGSTWALYGFESLLWARRGRSAQMTSPSGGRLAR